MCVLYHPLHNRATKSYFRKYKGTKKWHQFLMIPVAKIDATKKLNIYSHIYIYYIQIFIQTIFNIFYIWQYIKYLLFLKKILIGIAEYFKIFAFECYKVIILHTLVSIRLHHIVIIFFQVQSFLNIIIVLI